MWLFALKQKTTPTAQSMRNIRNEWLVALLVVAYSIVSAGPTVSLALAQGGGIQVLPTRVIFEGRKRSEQVALINHGNTQTTYRISFKNMRMLEDGSYEDVEEPQPGETFSDKMIIFSPRQVVLQPGETQTVRLLLRKKKGLAAGEYRSHMLFRNVPEKGAGKGLESLGTDAKEITITLIPIFGISIPVIVRHGNGSASVKITHPNIQASDSSEDQKVLSMHLERTGNHSTYGDMIVIFKPNKGSAVEVARSNGVVVYTPNKKRIFKLRLSPPEGVTLKNGSLLIEYRAPADKGGKILAKADISIP